MLVDNIGSWTQAQLRRYIINEILTDPGALPKSISGATQTLPSSVHDGDVPIWDAATNSWLNSTQKPVKANVLSNYPNDATKSLMGDGSWAAASASVGAAIGQFIGANAFISNTTDICSVSVTIGPSGKAFARIDPGRFVNTSGANQAPISRFYVDGVSYNTATVYSYCSNRDDLLCLNGVTSSPLRIHATLLTGLSAGSHTISWRETNSSGDGSGSTKFDGGARPVSLIVIPL